MIIDPTSYQQLDFLSNQPSNIPLWLSTTADLQNFTYVVPPHKHDVILVNYNLEIKCLSNICTHKHATILEGRGDLKTNITCPIHKWTWSPSGEILGARGFQKTACMNLKKIQPYNWGGHLFVNDDAWLNDIQDLGNVTQYLNIKKYDWYSSHCIEYNFDWKIFMEIFLDLYHVKSFHPGLSSLTDCATFDWVFGDSWSCQTAKFNRNHIQEKSYAELHDMYHKLPQLDFSYGAIWLGIYPNIMIEHYPGTIVVSTVWPNGPSKCLNYLEFYYEKNVLDRLPDFAKVQQRAFMVTADEDEVIGLRIQEGLNLTDKPFVSYNHPLEEAGYTHFHTWLTKRQDKRQDEF